MAVQKALLVLLMAMVTPSSSTMVSSLPGGGNIEVESSSRGQVCMYITDDWGTVESTQCISSPGTYTLTGRGGGQARVTVSEFGGISVNTGYFRGVQQDQYQSSSGFTNAFGAGQQQQTREEEDNSVRFGSYQNPRPVPPRVSYSDVTPAQSRPAHVARRMLYRRPPPPPRRRPTATPTLPPVRLPYSPNTVQPTFGPLVLPQGSPVTEAGLDSVNIIASGPGRLTIFGTSDRSGAGGGGVEMTGPSAPDSEAISADGAPPSAAEPLVARKKRNRLSAASSSDGAATVQSRAGGGSFSAVRADDGSTVLNRRQNGHRLTSVQSADGSSVVTSQEDGDSLSSVQSADGSSVVTSQEDGDSLSSVQSADGSSVVTSQTADGYRLGLVRSPDGSVVFSTFVDGRMVNVVRSSDGSSVVSTNIDGRQVTALTSPTGQRLIAGAGPGHNLDAFFNRVMLQLDSV